MSSVSPVFKAGCVALLVLQNSALTLTMRYSRGVLKEQYLTSTTVVLNEVVKLFLALGMIVWGFKLPAPTKLSNLPRHLASILLCRECLVMALPGLLYLLSNQLAFIGLENLEASTYALVLQLKILTTAFFARVMLGKQLHWYQWRALVLLVIGVVLVQSRPEVIKVITPVPDTSSLTLPSHTPVAQVRHHSSPVASAALTLDTPSLLGGIPPNVTQPIPTSTTLSHPRSLMQAATPTPTPPSNQQHVVSPSTSPSPSPSSSPTSSSSHSTLPLPSSSPSSLPSPSPSPSSFSSTPSSPTSTATTLNPVTGLVAAITVATLSGFTGCYIEKLMKGGKQSVWDRNVQLALYGIVFGLIQIWLFSSEKDHAFAREHGWLGGYSFVTCWVVLLNSMGGILVSLVVVYLDNIIRGFATSVAILLTAAFSYFIFHDVTLTTSFACGVVTVLISVANYQDTMIAPTPPAQANLLLGGVKKAERDGSGSVSGSGDRSSVELSRISISRPTDINTSKAAVGYESDLPTPSPHQLHARVGTAARGGNAAEEELSLLTESNRDEDEERSH